MDGVKAVPFRIVIGIEVSGVDMRLGWDSGRVKSGEGNSRSLQLR
jgi:hypothetical protein